MHLNVQILKIYETTHFTKAHKYEERHPQNWYNNFVNLNECELGYTTTFDQSIQMVAEPSHD